MNTTRQKYGIAGTPIQATKVYRKAIEFDHAETAANPGTGAWIYIAPDGRLGQANTYSGNLGRNFTLQEFPMPDEKGLKRRLKGYEEVDPAKTPGGDCFVISK